jgi:hypothetical protein
VTANVIGGGPTNSAAFELRTSGSKIGSDAPTLYRDTFDEQVLPWATNYSHADLDTNAWWDLDGNTLRLRAKGLADEYINWRAFGFVQTVTNALASDYTPPDPGEVGLAELLTDLIAYWRFDETTGARLDETTNSHDLFVSALMSYTNGVSTNAVMLSGSGSDYLYANDHDNLSIDSATFTGWIWMDSTNTPAMIFSKDAVTSGTREYSVLWSSSYNELRFTIATNLTTAVTIGSGTPLAPDAWHFFAATANTTNSTISIRTGSDGTLSSWATSSALPAWSSINTSESLRFGIRNNKSIPYPLDGRIDEVSFHHRVLTDNEVNYLFTNAVYYPWGN